MDATTSLVPFETQFDWTTSHKGDSEYDTFRIGPFQFKVVKQYDYDDWSGIYDLGKGISKPQEGAIKRRNPGWQEYEWFLPATTAEQHYRDLATDGNLTIEYCRQEASKYTMQDYNRWEQYNSNYWCYMGVVVAITYKGYELGSGGLWGIESDSDESYFSTVAWEQMSEVIDEALRAAEDFKVDVAPLIEFQRVIDEASRASWQRQQDDWAILRAVKPEPVVRDKADIPPYEPVDELEWRIVWCPRCGESDVTDEEDRYVLACGDINKFKTAPWLCRDCYNDLWEIVTDEDPESARDLLTGSMELLMLQRWREEQEMS